MNPVEDLFQRRCALIRGYCQHKRAALIPVNTFDDVSLWKMALGRLIETEKITWAFVEAPEMWGDPKPNADRTEFPRVGAHTPWEHLEGLITCEDAGPGSELRQVLALMEAKHGCLEWNAILAELSRLGAQHSAVAPLRDICEFECNICLQMATEPPFPPSNEYQKEKRSQKLPPHVTFILPSGLLSFSCKRQPVPHTPPYRDLQKERTSEGWPPNTRISRIGTANYYHLFERGDAPDNHDLYATMSLDEYHPVFESRCPCEPEVAPVPETTIFNHRPLHAV